MKLYFQMFGGRGASSGGGSGRNAAGGEAATKSLDDRIEDMNKYLAGIASITTKNVNDMSNEELKEFKDDMFNKAGKNAGLTDSEIENVIEQRRKTSFDNLANKASKNGVDVTTNDINSVRETMVNGKATFTEGGNSVKNQSASIKNGNQEIVLTFNSGYNPRQTTKPDKEIVSTISIRTYKDGNIQSIKRISETSTKSLNNAKKNYESTLDQWKKLTGQKTITF